MGGVGCDLFVPSLFRGRLSSLGRDLPSSSMELVCDGQERKEGRKEGSQKNANYFWDADVTLILVPK